MTTQRSLSAAPLASQGQIRLAPKFSRGLQWHRHSCLCAVVRSGSSPIEATTSLPVKFLIANPELEFHLSLIGISPLKFPNRKFLTILDSHSALNHCPLATSHSPLATAFLIHGSAIKTPRNAFKQSTYEFLIGGKRGPQASPAAPPQPPNLAPTPRVCYFPSRTPLE